MRRIQKVVKQKTAIISKKMDAYSQVPPPVPPPLPKKEDNFGKYALIAGGGCFLLLLFAGAVGFFI